MSDGLDILKAIKEHNNGKPTFVLRHKKTGRYKHFLSGNDLKSKYSSSTMVVVGMPKDDTCEDYELIPIKKR